MNWIKRLFFRSKGHPPDDDKQMIEALKRDLDRRNDASRARLTEIQVEVMARRNDPGA